MAVSPPPITITLSPTATSSPLLTRFRNSVPVKTFGASSPGMPQLETLVRADAHEDRLVLAGAARPAEHRGPTTRLHFSSTPRFENPLDLRVEHLARQAVLGDAVAQHPAGLAERLEHRDRIAAARQLIGAGKAGGTGADHRDCSRLRVSSSSLESFRPLAIPKSPTKRSSALMATAPSLARAVAGVLAGVRADAAADRGKRVPVGDRLPTQIRRPPRWCGRRPPPGRWWSANRGYLVPLGQCPAQGGVLGM